MRSDALSFDQLDDAGRPVTAANVVSRATLRDACDVAVIGAGPYGLAVAAHLKAAGIPTRVFGEAMSFWRQNMPKGMKLRSSRRATHIADPDNRHSVHVYAAEKGGVPDDPLPLEDFVAYGEWFQRRVAPNLDTRKVVQVETSASGFRLRLEDGECVEARRVVMAMGLANQEFKPPQFEGLPPSLVSHSADHMDLGVFRGRRVAVIGRGQSACESAVLLHEAGAEVEQISHGDVIWIGSEEPHGDDWVWRLQDALAAPSSVGRFPLNWLVEAPGLVRLLPADLRNWISDRCLLPAATAWLRKRAEGVQMRPGRSVTSARPQGSQIVLQLDDGSCSRVDHALLATGYRIDISKLGVLAPDLLKRIDRAAGSPRLSSQFESSVPGLHFVGSSAVHSLGPLMRFIAGAGYAARCVTRAAVASRARSKAP
jgi:cation diffusion facilitator CzcD-associated flavoprotein CzcO